MLILYLFYACHFFIVKEIEWNLCERCYINKLKHFYIKPFISWTCLVGPKGPGGTSIPNNYCNKCHGSNKKMGKACQCTSEFQYKNMICIPGILTHTHIYIFIYITKLILHSEAISALVVFSYISWNL